MKKDIIGIQIDSNYREKLIGLEMTDELRKHLKIDQKPDWKVFMEFCIGSEENYKIAEKTLNEAMDKSLPKNVSEGCDYCMGGNDEGVAWNCSKYYDQMNISYLIAVDAYCNIVNNNQYLKANRKVLQDLTIKFFNCLTFLDGKGILFFDLNEISKHCLYAGLLSISKIFSDCQPLQSLAQINNALEKIESQEIENQLYEKEDYSYLELQKKFFQKEQRYYKEKIYISEKSLPSPRKKSDSNSKHPTVVQYALYYIYLQQSGDFGNFHHHPEGKIKAIEELLKEEEINTSVAYFQKVYNRLEHYNTNRVAKSQVANIEYVVNTMLTNFPKAQKNALEELKEAKNKNR